jgi:DNA-binding NtrC family response regulator
MADDFDFISAADKPALLAFSTPELMEAAKQALQELGYKVHTAATHSDFLIRFTQIRYQVVILEELFAANSIEENTTLQAIQAMPMNQRRHATIVLLGGSFQTFTPMQAFQQSVSSVINPSELFLLKQLIEKSVADNDFFYHSFREVQTNLYKETKA